MAVPPRARPVRPFRHFRLVAFFVGVALIGIATGIVRVRPLSPPADADRIAWVLATSVALTAFLGFVGVFVHRLRVLPLRGRETQNYLKAIRRESEKYRALMEGAADMLLVVVPGDGRIRECNARAREALELPAPAAGPSAPMEPLALASIVAEPDLARLQAAIREAASGAGSSASLGEIRLKGRAGRTLVASARLAGIALEDERVVHVALRDLTLQKEMETKLQIHERLSSVGLLTAGVAHEINNPLEGIGNYLALLERDGGDPETRRRHLELVRHGFDRIREIVRDLLRFARPASGAGEADLSAVVESARKLATYSDRFLEVEVVVEGLDRPLLVDGDSSRLEQVVVNLLLNAATAMRSKGRISIRARRGLPGEGAAGDVELVVSDGGPGIPEQDLPRIFDPFFTTTQGTGLGLSVSYGIVRAHGGTLEAQNRDGGGAQFTIRLPAAASETRQASSRTPAPEAGRKRA